MCSGSTVVGCNGALTFECQNLICCVVPVTFVGLGCNAFLATWLAALAEKTSESWCGVFDASSSLTVLFLVRYSFLGELQFWDMRISVSVCFPSNRMCLQDRGSSC